MVYATTRQDSFKAAMPYYSVFYVQASGGKLRTAVRTCVQRFLRAFCRLQKPCGVRFSTRAFNLNALSLAGLFSCISRGVSCSDPSLWSRLRACIEAGRGLYVDLNNMVGSVG